MYNTYYILYIWEINLNYITCNQKRENAIVRINIIKNKEMICLQQFYNIFTTNPKWQFVTGYYYWVKKVISVLNSNLNQ